MFALPLELAVPALLAAVIAIVLAGPRMVQVADRLADVTGLGEAFVGAVLVGAATSLPDILATVLPAARGLPDLAVTNALGGVLAQTAFLAIADLTYRRANLEHAAASLPNLVQGTLLMALLGWLLALFAAPSGLAVFGVHPGTLLLVGAYVYGLRVVQEVGDAPMWVAVETDETFADVAEEPVADDGAPGAMWGRFAVLVGVLGVAGVALGAAGESIVAATGMSEAAVGVLLTGAGSSLAELVVSIAAVRAGALTLAVANVIGGNTFDTLLVGLADVFYRDGSIYGAVGAEAAFVAAIALAATAVITIGLLRRERHGVGNIGVESTVVLVLYGTAVVLVL